MRKNAIKVLMVFVFSFIAAMTIGAECQAVKYKSYDDCVKALSAASVLSSLTESAGGSTLDYMCRNATGSGAVNTCSLWIGSAGSATIPTITAKGADSVIKVSYWGTCTDKPDTTSRVWVEGDGGAIDDSTNVTRLTYGAFGSKTVNMNVAAFIAGAASNKVSECETDYTRTIIVGRQHGTSGSTSEVTQQVTVKVIEGDDCNEGDTCDDWMPASYPASNKWHGVTSIDIRIKNDRITGWEDNDIWAMPTDLIRWIACYYPGVQRTSDTEVGSLNGTDLGYTEEFGVHGSNLPTDRCLSYLVPVEYEPLYIKVNRVSEWQNKFMMYGDADQEYEGEWTRGDATVRWNEVTKQTVEGDAGKTFTEYAETGTPVEASIDQDNPSKDFRQCTCEKCGEPGWHDTSYADMWGYHESGYWDYSDGYCQRWDFNTCSCCTADWGDGFAEHTDPGPTQYTGHYNTYNKAPHDARVTFGPVSDHLAVRLPYNFFVSTGLSINTNLVYSGHADQVRVNEVTTTVYTRWNNVTIADYATQVPNATINLYTYVAASAGGGLGEGVAGTGDICEILGGEAKQCVHLLSDGRTLNAGGSLGGATDVIWSNLTYNAFDAAAGDWMCFASSASPFTVSGDTDMAGGDGSWVLSNPQCAIIAKKPSFQVWGGSLYSVGNIVASYNTKVNVYNEYKSDIQNNWKRNGGTSIYFTPWVEESLILKTGTTKTVASGAAAGLNSNIAGVGTSTVFCNDRAALSFANYSGTIGSLCNGSGAVGASGISNGISDRADLIEYWTGTGASAGVNVGSGVSFNLSRPNTVGQEIESATGSKIRYAYSAGNINLSGTVPAGTTYLIKSDGTVTITGDLKYVNSYTSFSQIPKVVIYAKNVNIQCGVSEVDAIIITGKGGSGNLNTCSNGGDVSSSERQNQLKIFGMVITDTINLERTYGAAANSGGRTDPAGIPSDGAAAEVFDYDSSILMWSEFMAGSNESDTLQTVYQHELAPRY